MRKVIFGGANSLDNFIARPNDAVDWLLWCDEAAALMAEFWPRFDTILMGRKTYEVAARNGQSEGFPGVQTYVFSRTLKPAEHPHIQIISSGAEQFVRDLKQQPGKEICLMGGGDLAKSFFAAKLIDEIGMNVHPLLLGQGIPLFHAGLPQIDLELTECRPFRNGCVYLHYRVK